MGDSRGKAAASRASKRNEQWGQYEVIAQMAMYCNINIYPYCPTTDSEEAEAEEEEGGGGWLVG